jgi:hypothetical protein
MNSTYNLVSGREILIVGQDLLEFRCFLLLTQQPLWDESNAPGGILAKVEENHPQSCFCVFQE